MATLKFVVSLPFKLFTTLKLNIKKVVPWGIVFRLLLDRYDAYFRGLRGFSNRVVVLVGLNSMRQAQLSRVAYGDLCNVIEGGAVNPGAA